VPVDRERSDDELAQTATAAGSEPRPAGDTAPLTGELGRYRLQRELGRGGMGVVHAAFDPDLERRVALKVLVTTESTEGRQRLLREARAMARLTHPNVVTVHEVGSTNGRDYIAMELIDGGTLEDWLGEPRSERDIIAAFVAAARGLAAAHAAGLVHRDFKPHNVLRHKDGRIVVTDFGLVVGVEGAAVDPLVTTLPVAGDGGRDATAGTTPSSLTGLTKTGSLLGTPAYMAPEQWTGGQVGPPTDQFAFCVALWEALTKERPYPGKTFDELSHQVCNGKRVDDGKLPRRLRRILARGLDPDPAKRWRSMEALIDAITRAQRRPGVALALGGGALALGGVAIALFGRGHGTSTPSCPAPVLDPQIVWSGKDAAAMRERKQHITADAFDRNVQAWLKVRHSACTAAPAVREARLTCLDGLLVRFDTVKQVALEMPAPDYIDLAGWLMRPELCETPHPPRLVTTRSDELRAVLARIAKSATARTPASAATIDQLVAAASSDPCASAYALGYAAYNRSGAPRIRALDDAERAAQQCGDDRIIADTALTAAQTEISIAGGAGRARLSSAEALVARVSQPDLEAQLEMNRAWLAAQEDKLDECLAHFDKGAALFEQSGMVRAALNTRLASVRLHRVRGTPADVTAIPQILEQIRRRAVAELGEHDRAVRWIDLERARWMWKVGDVAGADALRATLVDPLPAESPRDVHGRVVDENGAPVAGAEVALGRLEGDSVSLAIPGDDIVIVRTAADGRFDARGVDPDGIAIARLGDRRSPPVQLGDDLTLALAPTSRVSGKVDLHGLPAVAVKISAGAKGIPLTVPYDLSAPVLADGSFTFDGVPRGKVRLQTIREGVMAQVITSVDVDVNTPVVEGVHLDVKVSSRSVGVLVRSIYNVPMANAMIFVMPGKQASTNLRDVVTNLDNLQSKLAVPIRSDTDSGAVLAKTKPGDVFATLTQVPAGEISVCAIPLPEHIDDVALDKTLRDPANMVKVPVTCIPVGLTDDVVVVQVPPWPRFD
jgi:hypothetical protein